MRSRPLCLRALAVPTLASATALLAAASAQGAVRIEFTGMNLVYDGSSFYDGGSAAGGVADPADADPLATVDCFVDEAHVGALTSDVSLDFFIPDVSGIPAAPGSATTIVTPGNPGYFDLLIGTSPLASQFLLLDIASVSITYVDISGIVQFVFGGAVATSSAQNLPFGLQVADPVTVSISAQVIPNTITTDDGFTTGFEAFGTGEFSANAIPTPASAAVLGLGAIAAVRRRRA